MEGLLMDEMTLAVTTPAEFKELTAKWVQAKQPWCPACSTPGEARIHDVHGGLGGHKALGLLSFSNCDHYLVVLDD
jgi:hypothetical protein